jgi:hypothetical protein
VLNHERKGASLMVALSSSSPGQWKPTTRTLGALFAGSAVTLSATVVHGGPLLFAGDEAEPVPETFVDTIVTAPSEELPAASTTAPFSEPGQAVPWAPGATPQWSSPLKDLPVRRAPVMSSGPSAPAAVAATPTTAPVGSETAATESGGPAPPTGTTEATPQATDPPHGPVEGVLSGVADATTEIPH